MKAKHTYQHSWLQSALLMLCVLFSPVFSSETRTEGADVTVSSYGYDKGNNRTSKSEVVNGGSAAVSNYSYGTTSDGFNSNQLKSFNRPATGETVTFTYDDNGNRATRVVGANTDTYSYDYNNRLVSLDLNTSATPADNGLYEYQYDHRTRRVLRDESGASGNATRVIFSGGLSVQEVDESGGSYNLASPNVEYIRGSDYGGGVGGVLYTLRSGSSSFNYYNHRGDVLLKTDDSGVVTWEARYEAFGTRTHETGTNLDRQRTNTKDEDPTGLVNDGMRYRELETNVYLTRDPMGFVDGPNVYTYVTQNPWTLFDPLGLAGGPMPGFAGTMAARSANNPEDKARYYQMAREDIEAYRGDIQAQVDFVKTLFTDPKSLANKETAVQLSMAYLMGGGKGRRGKGRSGGNQGSPTTSAKDAKVQADVEVQKASSSEHKGGIHKEMQKPVGDGKDSHHIPDRNADPTVPAKEGTAIQMDPIDHRKTSSHGTGGKEAALYRQKNAQMIKSGQKRDVYAREVKDARNAAQQGSGNRKKYNAALQQMLKVGKENGQVPKKK